MQQAISFNTREIATALLKAADIRNGNWQIDIHFGIGAGPHKSNDGDNLYGVTAVIQSINLIPATEKTPEDLVIDAASIW